MSVLCGSWACGTSGGGVELFKKGARSRSKGNVRGGEGVEDVGMWPYEGNLEGELDQGRAGRCVRGEAGAFGLCKGTTGRWTGGAVSDERATRGRWGSNQVWKSGARQFIGQRRGDAAGSTEERRGRSGESSAREGRSGGRAGQERDG